jgi:thiamine-monophosphate kinase
VPYDAGVEAALLGVTAMIDVSDGLLADLAHVADASGVLIDVDPGRLEVGAPLQEIAGALGADPMRWVLTGGDDNALAATFGPDVALPERWRVVGTVGERGDAGPGVLVAGEVYSGPAGHTHFS